MNNKAIIQVEDLVKIYPGGTKAVDNVTFSVKEGEFFGFLGPNGAGKSTTMKILGTLLGQTSGKAAVGGYDVGRNPKGGQAHHRFRHAGGGSGRPGYRQGLPGYAGPSLWHESKGVGGQDNGAA